MATQCSVVYASWLARSFHLLAAISDAELALLENRAPDLDTVKRCAADVEAYYRTIDDRLFPEIAPSSKDGLRMAEKFRALVETLGLKEGDPLYDQYDDVADHAEVIALGADPQLLSGILVEDPRRNAASPCYELPQRT
ncbi:MAG: hypothetical protein HYZ37_16940 [Candidatus Solibacter usitatus]|nr:hypothetical protein [Candidatus Solibacter usitatus]